MLWDCQVQVRRQDTGDGDGRQGGARPRVQVSQGAGDYGGSRSPHLHIEYHRPTLQVLDEARGCVLIMQRFTRKGKLAFSGASHGALSPPCSVIPANPSTFKNREHEKPTLES